MYSPAITDFILVVENTSYMFVTGPNVVKTVTHEEVTSEELGGANTHATKSGVTHFTAKNEVECIQQITMNTIIADMIPFYNYSSWCDFVVHNSAGIIARIHVSPKRRHHYNLVIREWCGCERGIRSIERNVTIVINVEGSIVGSI